MGWPDGQARPDLGLSVGWAIKTAISVHAEFGGDPVVLVHGCFTTPDPELEVFWSDLRAYLENAGYPSDRIYGIDDPDDRQRIGLPRERMDPRCISRLDFADRIGEFVDAVLAHTAALSPTWVMSWGFRRARLRRGRVTRQQEILRECREERGVENPEPRGRLTDAR